MTEEQSKDTMGLLLIDGMKNTLLLPFGSDDLNVIMDKYIRENLKYVKRHKKKADLNADITAYLNKEYHNEERGDDWW